jgi:hypothetical protein
LTKSGECHAQRSVKAFLRTFVAGQKYVAVRGREPATWLLEPNEVPQRSRRIVEAKPFANHGDSSPNI